MKLIGYKLSKDGNHRLFVRDRKGNETTRHFLISKISGTIRLTPDLEPIRPDIEAALELGEQGAEKSNSAQRTIIPQKQKLPEKTQMEKNAMKFKQTMLNKQETPEQLLNYMGFKAEGVE